MSSIKLIIFTICVLALLNIASSAAEGERVQVLFKEVCKSAETCKRFPSVAYSIVDKCCRDVAKCSYGVESGWINPFCHPTCYCEIPATEKGPFEGDVKLRVAACDAKCPPGDYSRFSEAVDECCQEFGPPNCKRGSSFSCKRDNIGKAWCSCDKDMVTQRSAASDNITSSTDGTKIVEIMKKDICKKDCPYAGPMEPWAAQKAVSDTFDKCCKEEAKCIFGFAGIARSGNDCGVDCYCEVLPTDKRPYKGRRIQARVPACDDKCKSNSDGHVRACCQEFGPPKCKDISTLSCDDDAGNKGKAWCECKY